MESRYPCRGNPRISTVARGKTHGRPRKCHGRFRGSPPKSQITCICAVLSHLRLFRFAYILDQYGHAPRSYQVYGSTSIRILVGTVVIRVQKEIHRIWLMSGASVFLREVRGANTRRGGGDKVAISGHHDQALASSLWVRSPRRYQTSLGDIHDRNPHRSSPFILSRRCKSTSSEKKKASWG